MRLALYLVEAGFYERVEFCFLIVGHTKNPCDRSFNLLKRTFRKSNVYTLDQLHAKYNENPNVTATHFTEHRNWEKHLDSLYKRFAEGTKGGAKYFKVTEHHNFVVDCQYSKGPTWCRLHVSRLDADKHLEKGKDFAKKNVQNREQLLRSLPDLLKHPGISLIKRIELLFKWKKIIPDEYKEILCPESLVTAQEKKDFDEKKNAKARESNAKKSEAAGKKKRQRKANNTVAAAPQSEPEIAYQQAAAAAVAGNEHQQAYMAQFGLPFTFPSSSGPDSNSEHNH